MTKTRIIIYQDFKGVVPLLEWLDGVSKKARIKEFPGTKSTALGFVSLTMVLSQGLANALPYQSSSGSGVNANESFPSVVE